MWSLCTKSDHFAPGWRKHHPPHLEHSVWHQLMEGTNMVICHFHSSTKSKHNIERPKRCMTTDSSMNPCPKRSRVDTSHEACSEPMCAFPLNKMGQVFHVQQAILPNAHITLTQASLLSHYTIRHLCHAAKTEHDEHKNTFYKRMLLF